MNFINCAASTSGEVMRDAVVFWSDNIVEHIASLLRSAMGTTAVIELSFKEELKRYREAFERINENFKNRLPKMVNYNDFLRTNNGFINLLERIKFEGFSGYPVLQQSVFHYIYESRYVNAVLGTKNICISPLITTYFQPFLNNALGCIYNQTYFWSIIGGMHPSLIMGDNAFYNAINGYSKEFLTSVCNRFNNICYRLSSLKRVMKKQTLSPIFKEFSSLNTEYLEFLKEVRQTSHKIFATVSSVRMTTAFFKAVDHQISEHNLVAGINENIGKIFGMT